MSVDKTAVGKWLKSIQEAKVTPTGPGSIGVRLIPMDKALSRKAIAALKETNWLQDLLESFVKDKLVGTEGEIRKSFNSNTNRKHHPMFVSVEGEAEPVGESAFQRRAERARELEAAGLKQRRRGTFREDWINMDQGFSEVWRTFSRVTPLENSRGAGVGIGPWKQLEALPLNKYMQLSGQHRTKKKLPDDTLNSLFLAVEFGTGIAENVGSNWVRTEGKSKDPSDDGSWWLNGADGNSVRFLGQKGFHFLYDERSRKPRHEYDAIIRTQLPLYISEALTKRFGGGVGVAFS